MRWEIRKLNQVLDRTEPYPYSYSRKESINENDKKAKVLRGKLLCRRHGGLLRQRVLLARSLHGTHHVPDQQQSRGRPASQTAAERHRVLLPAREIPRWGEQRTKLRLHERVHRKVRSITSSLPRFNHDLIIERLVLYFYDRMREYFIIRLIELVVACSLLLQSLGKLFE